MAKQFICLSMFERQTAILYDGLSNRTENPLAKMLLLSIAQDSSKHSALLKGIADSISPTQLKDKDCEKTLGQTWQLVTNINNEITSKKKQELSLEELYDRLITLESSMGEEYFVFVQMQTLQYLTKEIRKMYSINLEQVKHIFVSIRMDEEHHREVLATLREMSQPVKKDLDNTPLVKFQSPDQWNNIPPNNS